jgi:hypothetical protein
LRFVKIVMMGASALIVLGLVIGFFFRATWNVERSITVRAKPETVHALLSDLERWPSWMPWSKDRDPSTEFAFEGHGVGAVMEWNGKRVGRNRLTLTSIEDRGGVGYEIYLSGSDHPGHGTLRLATATSTNGPATSVVWHESGDVGWNPIYRMLVPLIESALARDFGIGLERLKKAAEASG